MEKIRRNSLLYRSKVEYADFCINHVEGCAHGCRYPCYAMLMAKRFGRIKAYPDWLKPKLVENALELLDEEIPRYKDQIKFVDLCFTTDPFMEGYPEVGEMTLKIIEKLNANGIRCVVLTKGIYPKELINATKYGVKNEYGITLVSLDPQFKKTYEPYAAPFFQRIKALKQLHDAGLKTWVSMEPYPTPNLIEQDLTKLLESVSFVDKIVFGRLNYNAQSENYPDSASFYEKCAKTAVGFCKKQKISCHIKFGTQKEYNPATKTLFRGHMDIKNANQNALCTIS